MENKLFIINENFGAITAYHGKRKYKDLVIPSEINGITVREIKENVFENLGLTSVIIPESVEKIGEFAFAKNKLTFLKIPNTVIEIEDQAFYKNKLSNIIIGEGVKKIGDAAFDENNLIDISIIGDKTRFARDWVSIGFPPKLHPNVIIENEIIFVEKENLILEYFGESRTIDIPSKINNIPVKEIAEYSFENRGLTKITLPETIRIIGEGAFSYNNFTNLMIPEGVKKIGRRAFAESNIERLTISNTVSEIGDEAFVATGLKDLILGSKVQKIGEYAFADNMLEEVDIPNSVKTISRYTFSNNNLRRVIFSDNLATIDYGAFKDNELKCVELPGNLSTIGKYAFANNRLEQVIIPTKVHFIGDKAFVYNDIRSVTILGEESRFNKRWVDIGFKSELQLNTINEDGFTFDENLKKITGYSGTDNELKIPNKINNTKVEIIGESAFSRKNLTSITIPEGVISIEKNAFYDNNLQNSVITIPASVVTIGKDAFSGNIDFYRHAKIKEVNILGDKNRFNETWTKIGFPLQVRPGVILEGTLLFDRLNSTIIKYIGSEPVGLGYYDIPSKIDNNDVKRIGEEVFSSIELTKVNIPNGISTIGKRAFENNSLNSIKIPRSVQKIEEEAFAYNEIEDLIIPESVITIGYGAFMENNLTSITILGDGKRFNNSWTDYGFPKKLMPE